MFRNGSEVVVAVREEEEVENSTAVQEEEDLKRHWVSLKFVKIKTSPKFWSGFINVIKLGGEVGQGECEGLMMNKVSLIK